MSHDKISDEELAEKAYETWDMYGGRALGRWGAPYVLDAWLAVIETIRVELQGKPTLVGEQGPEPFPGTGWGALQPRMDQLADEGFTIVTPGGAE